MSRSTAQRYKRDDGHTPSMLSTLSTFVRRLLHLPMSNDQVTLSTILQLPSGTVLTVADVTDVLKHAYKSAVYDNTLNPDHARVCRLDFMKVPTGVQHEYVLAYVTVDGRPWDQDPTARLGIVQCERSVEGDDVTAMDHLAAVSFGSSAGTSISESSSDVDPRLKAADRLIVYTPRDLDTLRARKHWCLYEHTFTVSDTISNNPLDPTGISALDFNPPADCTPRSREDTSPPRLYDIAAAAIAINHYQPQYDLIRNQCYWFAAMIYYTLGGERAADARLRKGIPLTAVIHVGRTPDGQDSQVSVAQAGTFRGLVRAVTHSDVRQLYSDSVRTLYNDEHQKLYHELRDTVDKALEKDRALLQKDRALLQKERDLEEKDRIIAQLAAALSASGQPGPSGLPRPQ
ncbi:hypothetical protein PYCCODRAFT_1432880 [Trametes coccinea BRFM310]|uniref:Uncharacterized protein n=1 Tax=Trametes coccinea (strain BRFM310) TaxID=1353009 RepID=A0A1Y2IVK2_TRAC3|nr:hypothetical protein PYCCODRAFT_1432880 [Trametes coccinea BRFM310]